MGGVVSPNPISVLHNTVLKHEQGNIIFSRRIEHVLQLLF